MGWGWKRQETKPNPTLTVGSGSRVARDLYLWHLDHARAVVPGWQVLDVDEDERVDELAQGPTLAIRQRVSALLQ